MKDIKTLKTMISHLMVILNRNQRLRMLEMMVVILVGSFFELLGVSAMLPFIQALLDPEDLLKKPYISLFANLFSIKTSGSILLMVGIGIIIVYLIKNIYLSLSQYLQVSYSNNIKRQLSVQMLRSFMDRPYSFFVQNGSGVIIRGVGNDIMGVYHVVSNLFKIAAEGFVVIAVAIYLFTVDPILALGVLTIGMICMVVIVFGVKKKLTKLSLIYRQASAELGKYIAQVNAGIKDIMIFNKRNMFVEGYDNSYEQSNIAETKSEFAGLLPERVIEAGCISGIIIMILVRLGMGVDANEFVPKMAVFAMGAFRLLPSISRLTGYVSMLIYARPMLEATYDNIIAARQFLEEMQNRKDVDTDKKVLSFESVLEVRNIEWKYPEGETKVLNGLELNVRKGEAIGIIGESGSGKSTLADLLLGLYKPQTGGIYMDGVDVSTIPESWSRIMSYVPQMVFLMDDSVRSNIAFGMKDVDDDHVWNVLKKVSLFDYIKNLPEGLDTIVGERGVKLSGGQRQRIAIARALFIDPQILILDEATSALDNETEEAVMEAIDSLAGSMTLIIIAHRLTTLRNCNRIYEIVDGKAVERSKEGVLAKKT